MTVAGDCPAVRTIRVRLVDAARVTVDAPMDPVLGGHSGRTRCVVLVRIGVLLKVSGVPNLGEIHRLDRLDGDVRAVRLAGLVVCDVVVAGVGHRRRVVLLEPLDGPLLVLGLRLAEPVLLDVVEHCSELLGVEIDRRMEVLGDQRPDVFVDDLRLPAFGVDDEPRPVVDPVDDHHRRLSKTAFVSAVTATTGRNVTAECGSGRSALSMFSMSRNATSTAASTSAAGS